MPKIRLVYDGDGVYTEKEARIHKLTQATEHMLDTIPGVVDSVDSTSTTDALSANMGKALQDQINAITGLNRYLSSWDATTGLPVTDPVDSPRTYSTGDYYIVAVVAPEGQLNYRPYGNSYTPGVASQTVETEELNINDFYIYDGRQWILQINKTKEIIIDDGLSPTSRNAVENRAVYLALTTKQDNILDLGQIRAGAALGMTSVQPGDNITTLTNNIGYQTAGDVAVAISDAISELAPEGVGRGVLTLQKNGTDIDTFSADAHSNKTINITMTKSDVGLGNVDNTSDLDKPISTATKTYVDDTVTSATEGSKYVGPTAPSTPTEGMLWYDTTNDQLKVYDGTNWVLTGKVYTAGTGISISNNDEISNTGVISTNNTYNNIVYMTEQEYQALQNKDPNTLYSTPDGADIQVVDDSPYSSSWDGDTTHAPSRNAVYDVLGDINTLLANI